MFSSLSMYSNSIFKYWLYFIILADVMLYFIITFCPKKITTKFEFDVALHYK